MKVLKLILILVFLRLFFNSCKDSSEGPDNYSIYVDWTLNKFGPGWAYMLEFGGAGIAALKEDGIDRLYLARSYATATTGGTYNSEILEYQYGDKSWNGKVIFSRNSRSFGIGTMVIGKGRNDGMNRIYFTNESGKGSLHELTYSEGSWKMVTIDSIADIGNRGLVVKAGRNDGVNRIYCASLDRRIIEYTFLNGVWERTDLGAAVHSTIVGVAIGSVRNDAVDRIYAARNNGHIYEFTYSGYDWKISDIGTVKSGGLANIKVFITIGNGRSDGIEKVYASVGGIGTIYEFSCTAEGFWLKDSLDVGHGYEGLAVGPGRNDGIFRVYGTAWFGHLNEFSFLDNKWQITADFRADPSFSGVAFFGVIIGPGRGDGVNRVYGACNDGYVYEFSYRL